MYSICDSAMTIKVPVCLYYKEAQVNVLLDSGATDNLIDRNLIKKLRLGTTPLKHPRLVCNVDGSLNKDGTMTEECQLWIQRGNQETLFQFFITSLGEDRMILGYPWFAHENPDIDWTKQELKGKPLTLLTQGYRSKQKQHPETKLAVAAIFDPVKETPIPEEYQQHWKVFSEEEAQQFPPSREEDHAIVLKPDAPNTINSKIYPLSPKEDDALKAYLEENLKKEYIYEGPSAFSLSLFF
jgi:hypothetical protein